MQNKKISLFYADWCHHCTKFKEDWNYIENFAKENKKALERQGIRLITESFEADKDRTIMEKNNIRGFPTLIINDNGNVYEYNNERKAHAILNSVLNANSPQFVEMIKNTNLAMTGGAYDGFPQQMGGSQDMYFGKYRKYKEKYLKLKNIGKN